jgi:two-component sensor histidine kinase
MALHELETNAAKYGALSVLSGRVTIEWSVSPGEPKHLKLRWEEKDGLPVSPPTRTGFGTRLVQRSLALELGGEVSLTYEPTGVVCDVSAPLSDHANQKKATRRGMTRPHRRGEVRTLSNRDQGQAA